MDEFYIKRRVYAMGLMVECPFEKALTNCPLNEVRKLPLLERIEHFKMISDEEVGEIIAYHEQCSEKRAA